MVKLLVSLCVVAVVAGLTSADNISPPAVTGWGTWGEWERCPEGRGVQGFQIVSEPTVGISTADDTAMNGIKLFCGNPADSVTPTITSTVGSQGKWNAIFRCQDNGYVNGYQLKVEEPQGGGATNDDTSVNNIRIFCTKNKGQPIEADGERFGNWGQPVHCKSGHVVCGLQTQVEEDQGTWDDDTALNNIAMECCPQPA